MGISSQLPKPINTQTHLPFSLFLFCCYIINQARPRTTYIYERKKTTIIFSMSMLSARYLSNALALLYTTCNSSRPITEQLPSYKNHINIYCGIWIIRFIRQIGHWKTHLQHHRHLDPQQHCCWCGLFKTDASWNINYNMQKVKSLHSKINHIFNELT